MMMMMMMMIGQCIENERQGSDDPPKDGPAVIQRTMCVDLMPHFTKDVPQGKIMASKSEEVRRVHPKVVGVYRRGLCDNVR